MEFQIDRRYAKKSGRGAVKWKIFVRNAMMKKRLNEGIVLANKIDQNTRFLT